MTVDRRYERPDDDEIEQPTLDGSDAFRQGIADAREALRAARERRGLTARKREVEPSEPS